MDQNIRLVTRALMREVATGWSSPKSTGNHDWPSTDALHVIRRSWYHRSHMSGVVIVPLSMQYPASGHVSP
jgi:hypothetical protein